MITEQDLNQFPKIFIDVYHGNLDALEQYIQQGGNVNISIDKAPRSFLKYNLFLFACRIGQENIVKKILTDKRIDPQADNNYAIFLAASNGHLAVVNLLLKAGCDPQDDNNGTIRFAARRGYLDVVNRLLEVGCDPQAINNQPIRFAAENGHLAIVNRLLEVGCDPRAENNAAIRWAAENGHLAIVLRLLEIGCDPQAQDNYAIRKAALRGHKKVVCALYDAAFILDNPIPRNITPGVQAILDERIEYVSVMSTVFSMLAVQYQSTAFLDVAPQILEFEGRLHNNDIKKITHGLRQNK